MTLSLADFLIMFGLLALTVGPAVMLLLKIKTNDLRHIDLKIDTLTEHVTESIKRIEARLDDHLCDHEW